jgi:hypothetical protein
LSKLEAKRLAGLQSLEVVCVMRLPIDSLTAISADASVHSAMDSTPTDAERLARLSFNLPRSLYRKLRLHDLEQDMTLSAALEARVIRKELG